MVKLKESFKISMFNRWNRKDINKLILGRERVIFIKMGKMSIMRMADRI